MIALLPGCALQVPVLPPRSPGADGLVLAIHGGGDDPSVWADSLAATYAAALDDPEGWDVVALDWSDDADAALTAAHRGRRIGEALGPEIEQLGYSDLHLVAHSVGAHLAHAIAVTEGDRLNTQLTLLDPFVGSGLVRWGYGRERFGDGAAFAEAYVDTDDGVPST
ncbi:MAG: alpha/beta fold hydrolase, partial [Myxococcota bacterium]